MYVIAVFSFVRMLSYTCCCGSSFGCGNWLFAACEYGMSPHTSASVPTSNASKTYACPVYSESPRASVICSSWRKPRRPPPL